MPWKSKTLSFLWLFCLEKFIVQASGKVFQCPDQINCTTWPSIFDFKGAYLKESLKCLNYFEKKANFSSFTVKLLHAFVTLDKQDSKVNF